MENITRILAIVFLYFVGTSALIGGWGLLSDPSGEAVGLSLNLLENTPFRDFYFPALILLLVNGLGSLIIGSLAIMKAKYFQLLIVMQGLLLIGWIMIQMAMIGAIYWLQFLYGGIGLLIMVSGILLYEWHHHNGVVRKKELAGY
jgi:hypothetical protein